MYHVYVATLADGCFYVGVTLDMERREREHRVGNASAWTKVHPLTSMASIETYENINEAATAEIANTTLLMNEYGIDAVRGGAFTKVRLTKAEQTVLAPELDHNANRCFRCGVVGHYASRCTDENTYDSSES